MKNGTTISERQYRLLACIRGEMTGPEIRAEYKNLFREKLEPSTSYVLLSRLKAAKLLKATSSKDGSRQLRRFKLTPAGSSAAADAAQRLEGLAAALRGVLSE